MTACFRVWRVIGKYFRDGDEELLAKWFLALIGRMVGVTTTWHV